MSDFEVSELKLLFFFEGTIFVAYIYLENTSNIIASALISFIDCSS